MFQDLSPDIQARMNVLEDLDARDRHDGTPKTKRLRQIPPETGRFLAILAAGVPEGDIIEIGTSAGYSTLWLSLACTETGRKLTTFEVDENKIQKARETFIAAGVTNRVNLVHGDALVLLENHLRIAFCFIDAEKGDYQALYEIIVSQLVPGGILVADNVISHADELGAFIHHVSSDERVDSVIVPIGKGELICRKSSR